jgi:glycosyltransferase involved in cell wall biosynthesis
MDVSVIIPTYNRAVMLQRAIFSVLGQENCGKLDVIVIDDGSTDETLAILARDFPQVRIFKQTHKGAPAARNLGITQATGDYIALLDDDDEMTLGSLAVRIRALVENPDIDMVCADYQNCVNNKACGPAYFDKIDLPALVSVHTGNADVLVCENFFDAQLRIPIALTSSMMLRRKAMLSNDYFDESLLIGQDWEYALRFSLEHGIGLLPFVVAYRHCHDGNMAQQKERSVVGQVRLDRKVLLNFPLNHVQRKLLKTRLNDDLYEAAYYFARRIGCQHLCLKYLFLSLLHGLEIRKVKLFARLMFRRKTP